MSTNEETWFNLEKSDFSWPAADKETNFFELTIGVSTDLKVFKRSIYTVLDWLGDIGGLLDALRTFGGIFVFLHTQIRGD